MNEKATPSADPIALPPLPKPFRAQGEQMTGAGYDKSPCHLFCIEQMHEYAFAALSASQKPPVRDLHGAIMNIAVTIPDEQFETYSERLAYKTGHRDARHAAAEMALSASTQPQAGVVAEGWQPIETAPKDGTDVLLWVGGEREFGYFDYGRWNIRNNGDYREGGYGRDYTPDVPPAHWMPLPPAPTLPQGGQ